MRAVYAIDGTTFSTQKWQGLIEQVDLLTKFPSMSLEEQKSGQKAAIPFPHFIVVVTDNLALGDP